MNDFTTFLAAHPSFMEGISRVLDISGTMTEYNTSLSDQQADYIALRSDWRIAARDLGIAFQEEVAIAESTQNQE